MVTFAAVHSAASVVVPADLRELSREALAIAHGTVKAVEARWADAGRKRVETFVAIEVTQYLKGDLGSVVILRVPGGEIGRYRSVMAGAPTFQTGDEVVVFLGARGPSYPFLLGLSQGLYRVGRDASSGGPVVSPPPLIAGRTGGGAITRGAEQLKPWPLERFLREIRSLATQAQPGRDLDRMPRRKTPIRGGDAK